VKEQRKHGRSVGATPVRLIHESFGTEAIEIRDISHGGVYILNNMGLKVPPLGTIIDVQVLGAKKTPLVQAEVVRIDDEGFSLKFLQELFV